MSYIDSLTRAAVRAANAGRNAPSPAAAAFWAREQESAISLYNTAENTIERQAAT